jgi:hypothetical protein
LQIRQVDLGFGPIDSGVPAELFAAEELMAFARTMDWPLDAPLEALPAGSKVGLASSVRMPMIASPAAVRMSVVALNVLSGTFAAP